MKTGACNVVVLCGAESSSPVNYNDAGEQPVHVVTPLAAVLAVVSAFVMALLAIAFITDTGISYLRTVGNELLHIHYTYRYLILQPIEIYPEPTLVAMVTKLSEILTQN